ncbi:MAG: molybdopterin-guanine dinucleotide biosynthesis protein B [Candidatus Omnitrophica bacterium]|nr:molybdopterin-guanine dinucleotide biosynthesis protein B [Candidatus Omnitrophota bacterium]
MNENGKVHPLAIGIVGVHNSGKTTLIEKLIPLLKSKGYRVGTIKHTCHDDFKIDEVGTDTFRHREAGADMIAISSSRKTVFIKTHDYELSLSDLIRSFDSKDLVLVEGYQRSNLPKIAVLSPHLNPPPTLWGEEKEGGVGSNVFAIYSETPAKSNTPAFSSAKIDDLVELIEKEIAKQKCTREYTI